MQGKDKSFTRRQFIAGAIGGAGLITALSYSPISRLARAAVLNGAPETVSAEVN